MSVLLFSFSLHEPFDWSSSNFIILATTTLFEASRNSISSFMSLIDLFSSSHSSLIHVSDSKVDDRLFEAEHRPLNQIF